MPKYAVFASYTPEQWARVVGAPAARGVALRAAAEAVGGAVDALYWMFGNNDLLAIITAPDSTAQAALSVSMASTGVFSSFATHELISADDLDAVVSRAKETGLVPDPPE
ncbi:MAG: GYD domain-containing protein [Actinomycetota bacterium]|jgi:uncharacterized protein with GYD domain|nr:GYD domain-containing protein [Actinomycetota bacterium]